MAAQPALAVVSRIDPVIQDVRARAYRIPTSSPEADGTARWDSTTLVLARVQAAGREGIGYTYSSKATADVIADILCPVIRDINAFDIEACWQAMRVAIRNYGQPGICATAISAVDNALWDLKAKLLGIPLLPLLGASRQRIEVYGSGGFTTYSLENIIRQIEDWRRLGISKFKIKIGRDPGQDFTRIEAALRALPPGGKLFVDANGAYNPQDALEIMHNFAGNPIVWFEEPVSSDDVRGLAYLRQRTPPGLHIAAGEYGYTPDDFLHLLDSEAVDTLQVDATRCMGVTGFLKAAALTEAYHRPLSAHCAPLLHAPLCCHALRAVHIEYFWDHARIEDMLFDGAPRVEDGCIAPQVERPGLGVVFKEKDAEQFAL